MKVWVTVPGTAHHSARTGAARSASFTGGSVSAQSVEGTSSMPPSSPASGRRRSSTCASSRSARKASPTRTGRSGLAALHRQRALDALGVGGAVALQRAHQARGPLGRAQAGAEVHQGLREIARPLRRRQRAAPGAGSRSLAAGSGFFTANSRATTRSMLPSTGVAGAPKAMAAIAAAV